MKKFLGVLCLILFLAGLGLSQETQPTKTQERGQPMVIQLFGISWSALTGQKLGSFDDLNADIVMLWAKDKDNIAGIIEIAIITSRDKKTFRILYGWIRPYSLDEQGFFLDENGELILLEKRKDIGWELESKGGYNQEGNPVLIIYLKETSNPESEKVIRIIDFKKFVEENFKDEGNSQK